eukprot:TRINITY_DN63546_c0_g1_i1.p1 TRINITY_DN63546_c0_g1~~TRINITY_DN63546_c0_g1_i1.p1  ORF type:complete len:295 (-),score=52.16 TRINITY_DN63546_c0_g1_i1:64-948(-)
MQGENRAATLLAQAMARWSLCSLAAAVLILVAAPKRCFQAPLIRSGRTPRRSSLVQGSWQSLRAAPLGALSALAAFGNTYGTKAPDGHDSTIIWIHGLGDTGEGWSNVARKGSDLRSALPTTRFLFPTAQIQPVTMNGGMPMPSWFDVKSVDPAMFTLDPPGLAESMAYIGTLVQQQVTDFDVPLERVVLAGFSQGGAVALATAFAAPQRLGGVLMLSSFRASSLPEEVPAGLPVHFFHGEDDPLVPMDWSKRNCEELRSLGVPGTYRSYPGMAHSSCPEELADVGTILSEILG